MQAVKGFTLIELLVTIAIIGILASIGIPAYGDYVIRGKLIEAPAQLSDARIKMEQFFQDYRVYNDSTGGNPPCLSLTTTSAKYFTFSCAPTADTYTVTATSKANQGLGVAGDYTYTINQNNAKATTKFAGTASTAACWQMKRGEAC